MLLYLHGFNSTPDSKKATQLRSYLQQRGMQHQFVCPALPHWPDQAIALAQALITQHAGQSITLIGSSLGGYYATWLAERHDLRAVLINPAVYPHRDLHKYLGPQRNLYSGEQYELTLAHIEQLQALWVERIDPRRFLLLVETGDEVLDYRQAMARYAGAQQVVVEGGDHTLQSFPQQIPRILAFAAEVAPL